MKLPLAILLTIMVHAMHGAVVAITMQPSYVDQNPLEVCKVDSIIHDELTALLTTHGALMVPGHQTARSLTRDLYSKYYRNPFEKFCLATGYCNPFGTRRNLRGTTTEMNANNNEEKSCDGSIKTIQATLKILATDTFDTSCKDALRAEILYDCV